MPVRRRDFTRSHNSRQNICKHAPPPRLPVLVTAIPQYLPPKSRPRCCSPHAISHQVQGLLPPTSLSPVNLVPLNDLVCKMGMMTPASWVIVRIEYYSIVCLLRPEYTTVCFFISLAHTSVALKASPKLSKYIIQMLQLPAITSYLQFPKRTS